MMQARTVGVVAAALSIGCVGNIGASTNTSSGTGTGTGGAGAVGGPSGGDKLPTDGQMKTANPELFTIAAKYFPGDAAAGAPKRVFRLTRTQLDATAKALLPTQQAASALAAVPPDPLQTSYEYAANLSFNAANFTPYTKWVDEIVAGVRANPASVINCVPSGNSPTCLQSEAKRFLSRAFRGTASDAALARHADFFTASVAAVGVADATADLVSLALTSPSFVFRDEVLTDVTGFLLPAERLQNMTYTLADAPPETVGLSSAMPVATLLTSDDVQATANRILDTPAARAKLLRFFTSWLEVKESDEFTIAPSAFPEFTPAVAAAVVEETRAFLNHHLSRAAPTLKDLTQSTQSFVSDAGGMKVVDLDPAQRLGIFTLPGVIASHSGPTTTRLVKRGVFFTRKVMCLPLGQPPASVDTTIPASATGTERQKIESVTQAGTCTACHAFINPFGFMQENYDAIGRWRTTDQGLPIDASISVSFLDEGPMATTTPVDALKGFTGSMRFKQCFVRQLFRFYMGRDELPTDDPVLRQMFFGFATNDAQDIVQLLRVLATSSAFSQRTEAP
jgi:Protein of unknown function (DUF1588)/Protein of unknown function (DUF1592)